MRHSRYLECSQHFATLLRSINMALAAQRQGARTACPKISINESAKMCKVQDLSLHMFCPVAVPPSLASKTKHQAVNARMGWDHAALYLEDGRSTDLELLQLRLAKLRCSFSARWQP